MYLGVLDASGFLGPLSTALLLLGGKKEIVTKSENKKLSTS
jgi:hypothetical protein